MTENDVIIASEGGLGRITLNRPKALHALTRDMCDKIIAAVHTWEVDPAIAAITIDHSEGRGFCAGGDIRLLFESLQNEDGAALDFFHAEYRMNHLLFTLRKPSVCFMDGIVMGGGAGLAMPCRHRVATESTAFAMPETGIGLFPDVGGGWFLSRLPGRIGQWLALTGARLNGADCLALDLATHYLPREALSDVKMHIGKHPEALENILRVAKDEPPPSVIGQLREKIDRLFAADRIEDIVAALEADTSLWAAEQLGEIAKKAPISCKVALQQLARGHGYTRFSDNMMMEYRIVSRLIRKPDFIEGVRAFVIDKDNCPHWMPQHFDEVTNDEIEAIFAPLPEHEEWTPLGRD